LKLHHKLIDEQVKICTVSNEKFAEPLGFIAGMDDPGVGAGNIRVLPPVGRDKQGLVPDRE
jgi:hypothetical protein